MNTSSFAFPNMFDVSKNKVSTYSDGASITSRVKLLLLTEPTELYNSPQFGVGLKRYMFQYNGDNTNLIPEIRDRIIAQLRMWEPHVDADRTEVTGGLLYTEGTSSTSEGNSLKLTVTVYTIYDDVLTVEV